MGRVYISGIGMTPFGKRAESLEMLMAEASEKALEDAGIDEVDAIYIGVMNAEEFINEGNIASRIADFIGMAGKPAFRVETASSTGAAALHAAFHSVASGYYRNVLVLAGEKMTHLSTARTTKILAGMIERIERGAGITMPALAAMVTERYSKEHRISINHLQKILAQVAIKNHHNGSMNHYAQFQQEINEKIYFDSKFISFPLRLYDCAPITDGVAAVILTSDKTDVTVAGIGHGTDTMAVRIRDSLTSFRSTKIAAKKAYEMAQLGPKDVNFAEVHDAFTIFELIATEDLGFFPLGKSYKALEKGITSIEGAFPINPSGGLKARGHPVGASGLAQIVEIVLQMREKANIGRQVKNPSIGLAQSTGGLATNNFVTILERMDRNRLIQSHGKGSFSPQIIPVLSRKGKEENIAEEGTIETFTIVYVTPEGFPSPLPIAFIKDTHGNYIIARGQSVKHLKIGKAVYIKKKGEAYQFAPKSLFRKFRVILKKTIRRLLVGARRNVPLRKKKGSGNSLELTKR